MAEATTKRCTNPGCYMKAAVKVEATECIACGKPLKDDADALRDLIGGGGDFGDLLGKLFGR